MLARRNGANGSISLHLPDGRRSPLAANCARLSCQGTLAPAHVLAAFPLAR